VTSGARSRRPPRSARGPRRAEAGAPRGSLTPQFFRALADPTRLRLVNLLVRGTLCVCDLQRIVGEPQSTVSRHLAYLKSAGLVADRRDGVRIFYRLAASQNALHAAVFEAIRAHTGRGASARASEAGDLRRDLEYLDAMRAAGDCHDEPLHAARRAGSGTPGRAQPAAPSL
jgi:ArsR family transcriptional regulator, arsenate/arsenite/antimonite-responsive transcriptional repressor